MITADLLAIEVDYHGVLARNEELGDLHTTFCTLRREALERLRVIDDHLADVDSEIRANSESLREIHRRLLAISAADLIGKRVTACCRYRGGRVFHGVLIEAGKHYGVVRPDSDEFLNGRMLTRLEDIREVPQG